MFTCLVLVLVCFVCLVLLCFICSRCVVRFGLILVLFVGRLIRSGLVWDGCFVYLLCDGLLCELEQGGGGVFLAQESRMREEKQTRTIAVLQHSRQDLSDGKFDAACPCICLKVLEFTSRYMACSRVHNGNPVDEKVRPVCSLDEMMSDPFGRLRSQGFGGSASKEV